LVKNLQRIHRVSHGDQPGDFVVVKKQWHDGSNLVFVTRVRDPDLNEHDHGY
jgi:hypothetical protein